MASNDHIPVAKAFFDTVMLELEKFGGVRIDANKPMLRSLPFALAAFDYVGELLARSYHSGELDYETADMVANFIEGTVLDTMQALQPGSKFLETPSGWSEVYEAFDAGEFDHFGRSRDPIAEYTDPQIARFLARIDGTVNK